MRNRGETYKRRRGLAQATVPHEPTEGADEAVGLVACTETKYPLWDSALQNRFKPLSFKIPLHGSDIYE